jgi:VWFA-related protein
MSRVARFALIALPAFLLIALTFGFQRSYAQQDGAQRVIINYTTVSETDTQQLDLFFTVLTSGGQAVLNPQIDDVSIALDNSAPVEILGVTTPNIPFFITLVLDASGSMGPVSAVMQAAANGAINNMPSDAQVSVIRFNQQIDLLQGFTTDRNLVAAAINQSSSVRNSGTCLYDAMFQGLELLNTAPNPARRALIVFTDGRDEITAGRGDTCSENSQGEVIDLATGSGQPIPIYTIGLRGDRNINETELRNFADATGGLSAIGDQTALNDLFLQIVNSLRSQLLVQARLCSEEGTRTATLIVDTGTPLQPDVTQFLLETSCSLPTATPLPSATPTPQPVELFIESFEVDNAAGTLSFEVRRTGDVPFTQLRVQIADGDTNAVQEQRIIDIGTSPVERVEFPLTDGIRGDIEIIVSALDARGNVVARADESFGIALPTATPTLSPAQVFIDAFTFNIDDEIMQFELQREGATPVSNYRILVNDATTGVLLVERTVEADAAPTQVVQLSTADIPGGSIEIVINALDADGSIIARRAGEFAIVRPTATPTATPIPIRVDVGSLEFDTDALTLTLNLTATGAERIRDLEITIVDRATNLLQGTYQPDFAEQIQISLPTLAPGEYDVRLTVESANGEIADAETSFEYVLLLTPTPEVRANLAAIEWDAATETFNVQVDVQNEAQIIGYRVQIINRASGILVNEFTTFDVPPFDQLSFSSRELPEGEYVLQVTALDAEDQPITSSEVEFDWTPPPPPTPTPTPGIVEVFAQNVRESPPLAIGVVVVVLGLLGLLFALLRGRGKKEENWGSALPAAGQTGVINIPRPPASAGAKAAKPDDEATQIIGMTGAAPIAAMLFVARAAEETGLQGQRVSITSPFSIGRSGSSLNFAGDKSVSRSHALITFDGTNYVIQDQGSGNGTIVNDKRLAPDEQAVLRNGTIIKIGTATELMFEMGDDKTQIF